MRGRENNDRMDDFDDTEGNDTGADIADTDTSGTVDIHRTNIQGGYWGYKGQWLKGGYGCRWHWYNGG